MDSFTLQINFFVAAMIIPSLAAAYILSRIESSELCLAFQEIGSLESVREKLLNSEIDFSYARNGIMSSTLNDYANFGSIGSSHKELWIKKGDRKRVIPLLRDYNIKATDRAIFVSSRQTRH